MTNDARKRIMDQVKNQSARRRIMTLQSEKEEFKSQHRKNQKTDFEDIREYFDYSDCGVSQR